MRVGDRQARGVGRGRVVRGRDGLVRPPDRQPARAEAGEGLGARDLVDEVEVDREDGRRAGLLGDDVVVPDLLDERAAVRMAAVMPLAAVPERTSRRPSGRRAIGEVRVAPVLSGAVLGRIV